MKDFSKYSAIIIGAGDATGSAITKNLHLMDIKFVQQEDQEILIN